MPRIKAPSIPSRAEFERIIDQVAQATVSLRKLEAERDKNLQIVREAWDPSCAQQSERIASLSTLAEKYAEEHREDLFPRKAKSAETPLAIFGFRTGMPQLKLLSKWTWEKVLEAFDRSCWGGLGVRVKREIAKDRLIDAAQKHGDGKFTEVGTPLSDFGLKVVQSETFFIEPKDQQSKDAAA